MPEPVEVEGLKGALVVAGLGKPIARAFCATALVGCVAYAFKLPPRSFTEEGQMRPWKVVSKSPEACHAHFLCVPLTVAFAVYAFT